MAIYKRGRESELGTIEHKSSKWTERDSNPGPSDCESDALTTRPRCPLLQRGFVPFSDFERRNWKKTEQTSKTEQ